MGPCFEGGLSRFYDGFTRIPEVGDCRICLKLKEPLLKNAASELGHGAQAFKYQISSSTETWNSILGPK